MRPKTALLIPLAFSVLSLSSFALQSPQPWWPSEWGADDERGAINRVTPAKTLAAAKLIETGRIYQLGRVYEAGMPLFGNRHFSLTIPGSPTGGPMGANGLVWHDEIVSGEIGQVGTQFDGLGHIGVRIGGTDYFYNGFQRRDFSRAYGLEKLGVEKVGAFFTRGVLVDIAGFKGVERLEIGYVISPEDIEGALKKQGVAVEAGDAVFFHTGHGALWMKYNQLYNQGEPGIGMAAARWLAEKKIALTGADTWATEAVPGPDSSRAFEVHQFLIAEQGIYNLENLFLEELVGDEVWEFAFIFSPLRLKGATGSPGNPIAVR